MSSRFVRPETTILRISNGDTLTVKRRLNAVDSRRLRAMEGLPTLAEAALVIVYLVDWSLVDDAGKRVVIAGESATTLANSLDNLDEDAFDEIYAAISAHVQAMKMEREAEKKMVAMTGAEAISPSPSIAIGASTGSETLM